MSQRQQLERIMAIDRSIRDEEYPNADRLGEMLEVSRRVIFNDRDFMINRLGAPIEYDRQRGGWFYANKTWVLPGMIVTEGELLAFFLSVEISKRFLGSSLESSLRSAIEKISKGVKGPVSVDLDTLRSHFTFSGPMLISSNEQALLDIHQAIQSSQCLWMRYFTASRGESTERTVMPYHLFNIYGDWYLIAFDDLRKEFRNFLVARMSQWKILPKKFQMDVNFSASKWMEGAFQAYRGGETEEVSIRFTPQVAHYIRERRWHASQKIEESADGSLILHMQTAGLSEVKHWVLHYGAGAEVLVPDSLREECRMEIKSMAEVYRGDQEGNPSNFKPS
ncbi:MAG: WYL domain-containing transcriptional regulator [Chloroflexi bacterium]|nr:WYL domain-containing transcriptional regulator [Chloroflexota bacterium]